MASARGGVVSGARGAAVAGRQGGGRPAGGVRAERETRAARKRAAKAQASAQGEKSGRKRARRPEATQQAAAAEAPLQPAAVRSRRRCQLCRSERGVFYFADDAVARDATCGVAHVDPKGPPAGGALVLPRRGDPLTHAALHAFAPPVPTASPHPHHPPLDLCDPSLQRLAEREGAINVDPACTPFVVVRTFPDGNCLSHAASLGVWGVHDTDQELRRAVWSTMAEAQAAAAGSAESAAASGEGGGGGEAGHEVYRRFETSLLASGMPAECVASEWTKELEMFRSRGKVATNRRGHAFLSDVHCFVLANVLRRPLLVYGGATARMAGLVGVYLPLLWRDPACCSRVPTCVFFHNGHYSLLAMVRGDWGDGTNGTSPTLPLADRFGPLPVRFLLPEERGNERQVLLRWLSCMPLTSGGGGTAATTAQNPSTSNAAESPRGTASPRARSISQGDAADGIGVACTIPLAEVIIGIPERPIV